MVVFADAAEVAGGEGEDGVEEGWAYGGTLWYHAAEVLEWIGEVKAPGEVLDEVPQ